MELLRRLALTLVCALVPAALWAQPAPTGALTVNQGTAGTQAWKVDLSGASVTQGTSPWVISFVEAQHIVCDSGCGSAAATPDGSAFTAGVTTVVTVAGAFNEALADLSSGTYDAPRITKQRAWHINLRDSAGTEIGTVGAALYVRFPSAQAVTLTTIPNSSNLDIALSALRDAITAASPNNKTLNDLYTLLNTIHTDLTTTAATAANQTTGNASLASIKTDVDPLVTAGAGGFVRQDSTATIAKESGGNLATLVTNTTSIATSTNQTATQAALDSIVAPAKLDVVGGRTADPIPQFSPLPLTSGGAAVVVSARAPAPGLPLLPCNPVRRTNCQPKGF